MDMSGVISFTNSATAGSMTVFTNNASPQQFEDGGVTMFSDNASAGSALFINNGAPPDVSLSGGRTELHVNSHAHKAGLIHNHNSLRFLERSRWHLCYRRQFSQRRGRRLAFFWRQLHWRQRHNHCQWRRRGGDCAFGDDWFGGAARVEVFGNGILTVVTRTQPFT